MEPRFRTALGLLGNLFEDKVVYRERFIYVVRLENVMISSSYFGAIAVPLLAITPAYLESIIAERRLQPHTEPWEFGTSWDIVSKSDDSGICSPYAGWTVWIKPDLVRAFELLARAGLEEQAIKLLDGSS